MIEFRGVRQARLVEQWPLLWPMLAKACAVWPATTEAFVRSEIEATHAQLWTINDRGRVVAAVVTKILEDPRGRTLLFWIAAGTRLAEWAPDFVGAVGEWARGLGCVRMAGGGRRGWRWTRRLGFTPAAPDEDGMPMFERAI